MEQLPPWLRNLPLPPRPAGFSAAPVVSGADEEVPEWLRELQSEIAAEEPGASGAAEEPDWLSGLRETASPPPAEQPAAEEPDWLSGLRETASPPPAEQPAAEEPDWLSGLRETASPPPAEQPAAGELDWLSDLQQAAASGESQPPPAEAAGEQQTSTNSRVKMPVGATDWLRSIGQDPDAKSEPLSEALSAPLDESGVPDWLRDLSPDEVARGVESDVPDSQPRFDPQAPGWLSDDLPVPDASTVSDNRGEERPQVDETADAGDVPDWLRDVIAADKAEPEQSGAVGEGWQADAEPSPQLAAGAEMPAWLRDLGEAPPPPAQEPALGETPDWLRREADELPAEPLAASSADDEVPAWLREAEEGGAEPRVELAAADDEVPAWLREADEGGAALRPEPMAVDDEVPAWLREAEEGGAEPRVEPAAADDEVPAWLREAEQEAQGSANDPSSPTWLREALAERGVDPGLTAPEAEAVPEWLRDDSQPAPLPSPPQRPAADLPPWLAAEEAATGGSPAPAASASDLALPSWLRGVADEPPAAPPPGRSEPPPPPPRRPVPVAEEGDSSSGFMLGAELPSWLRVPEPELPGETAEGQQLGWLRSLGGPDQDDDLDSVAQLAGAEKPQRRQYQRSAEQSAAVALLQSLSRAPYPAPVAAPAAAPRTALQRIGVDRIIYALLALALILGLLLPQLTLPFQTPAPAATGAAELGALLDGLGSEDVVLVAYEWGAQRSSELRPLEQAALSRLTAEKTKLILVSTDMQGTLLSFDLRGPLRAAGYNVEPDGREFGGRDYVLLGYRPGGELALRSLVQDLRGELASDFTGSDARESLVANTSDGTPRIGSIRDLALILVLADQPQDVQVWMEQVHRAVRDEPAVPIAFLLPQEAEPIAQPYLRLPNVYHVAGQQGALALLGGDAAADAGMVARVSGQHWYSVLVFVTLLLLGGLGAALTRAGSRRSRGGAA